MNQTKSRKKTIRKIKKTITGGIGGILKIGVCIMFLFPFVWTILTSFKTYGESIKFPPTLIPEVFTTEAYASVLDQIDLWLYIKNTLIILVVSLALQLLISVPCAYAFARYKVKENALLFGGLMIAFMIPTQITFIPIFEMFSKAHMLDTLWPQILPGVANAFTIFMMRQSFMQVPEELIESAYLDEANELQVLTKIMLPMSKSNLVTAVLLSFIGTWNAYFWPLVITIHEEVRPIALAIDKLKNLDEGMRWPTIMAGNVIMLMPVLILFLIASKKIMSAMAYRGVK